MRAFLRATWTVAAKDLRTEVRNREVLNAAGAFALVVLLLFSFAFDPIGDVDVRSLAGGLLWIVYLFAGTLVLNRSFARESANDCLSALTAAPVPGSAVFLGKTAANAVLIFALILISLPFFGIFYDIRWASEIGRLLPVFALGAWALAAVGVMFGAVTARNRLRELMLPLLVYPLTLPALLACVELTTLALAGEPWGEAVAWLKLLFSFDVIFTLLGGALLEPVLTA